MIEYKAMYHRLKHIDIARGIAILLIVFGHSWIADISDSEKWKLTEVISSIAIPLFFFLSGLFFKPKLGLKYLVMRKTDSLLKPYFVVLSVLAVLLLVRFVIIIKPTGTSILAIIGYFVMVISAIIGYFYQVIYGVGSLLPLMWSPLWFLPCLWTVYIFSYIFIKAVGYEKRSAVIKSVFLLVLLCVGFFTIGLLGSRVIIMVPKSFSGIVGLNGKAILNVAGFITSLDSDVIPHVVVLLGLPFSIDIVCLTAFYFLCGFTMREKISTIGNMNNNGLLFFLSAAVFVSLHYFFNYTIDLNRRIYDNLLICTTEALFGIYITLVASSIISRNKVIGNTLAYIGSGSLFIFIFHYLIQKDFFAFLHKVINLGPYLSSFVAFPVAVCVPLLLWEIVKRNYYLSLLLLPLKSNKALQTAGEEKGI